MTTKGNGYALTKHVAVKLMKKVPVYNYRELAKGEISSRRVQ